MIEFDTPAVVAADPEANATDLLVDRVAATPDSVLFSLPDRRRRLVARHDRASSTTRSSPSPRASSPPASSPATRSASCARPATSGRSSTSPPGSPAPCSCPSTRPARPRRCSGTSATPAPSRSSSRPPTTSPASTRCTPSCPPIRNVWQIDLGDLDKLAAAGTDVADDEIERRRNLAVGSDIATLIYTSGSTGKPKGCVLTHSNFVELCRNAAVALKRGRGRARRVDAALHHDRAHLRALHRRARRVHAGVRVGHQPDTKQLLPSLGSFKPTFLLAVPRVFEKVYNVSEQKAEAGGKGKIFRAAADVAVAHSTALGGRQGPARPQAQVRAVRPARLLEAPRGAWAATCKYAVSGSAPLGPRLGHFYHSLGITILEGYGLTETTAPATVNLATKSKIGTVGPALPGVVSAHRRRRRDPGQGHQRLQGVLEEPRGDRRGVRRRLVQDRRHRLLRRRRLPHHHRSQEGDHRHGRRQERRPGRARGPDPRQPARRPGRRRRRQEAVHLGAHHARPRDAPGVAQQQRRGRRHDARRGGRQPGGARRGAARDRRRQRDASRAPSRSASSRSSRPSSPRRAAT